jgi:hypothetical protein
VVAEREPAAVSTSTDERAPGADAGRTEKAV